MLRFVVRRLPTLLLVIVGASMFSFALAKLAPGDVTTVLLGPYTNQAARAALRHQLALDQPLPVQYVRWVTHAATGDLGNSIQLRQPVLTVLETKLPNTLLLGCASFAIALVLGIGAGLLSALTFGRAPDHGVQSAVGFMAYVPVFFLGVVLIYVFSIRLQWLPSGGMGPPDGSGGLAERLRYLVLPAIATAGIPAALIAKSARASFHEQLQADFMRTARAKGLSARVFYGRHLWRAALPSILHVSGLQFAYLVAGTVVFSEVVFNWPGIGLQIYDAVAARDLPMIQGIVLLGALITVTVNLAVDIIHAWLDPRVRKAGR